LKIYKTDKREIIVEDIGTRDIKRIIAAIHESGGIDFSNYAFSSFKRRILRFTSINKVRDVESFIEKIRSDPSYADSLSEEITVNVTEMFRDPSFWSLLRDTILPQVRKKGSINIWHAACSTGEEVYSMAILLHESGLLDRADIVATDLNNNVLKVAEKGIYPVRYQETNSKNYIKFGGKKDISNYYTIIDRKLHFDRELIRNVKFMCHNLAQDGPVSVFDLILCRNVLIYFNFELQERVIKTFYESMQAGSFLAIGSKESIRWCKVSNYFREESFDEKVYRKVSDRKHYSTVNVLKTNI
jgi:chemotaxis protein methyltransferase CheR